MNILIISGTPKPDGLCSSLVETAKKAAHNTTVITLSEYDLSACRMCGDGWGICRSEHRCAYGDDGFDSLHEAVKNADAYVLITPVYWSEVSEAMKCFLDRLRRCEAIKQFGGSECAMTGKKCILVASPGGSGNGLLSALEQLDRAVRHMGAQVFDYIGVNRWNQTYKREALKQAVEAMARSGN